MSTMLYSGFDSEGRRMGGAVNLTSEERVKEYLHKLGIDNYQIFESKTIYKRGNYKLVTPKELSIFCKQISVLFYSHIMLMEGVVILAEQTGNKQLKLALEEIFDFMEKGRTFADTMCMYSHVFPSYMLNMISIGETSGTLDAVFLRLSSYFEKEHQIRKSLRSAITYPAMLTALMSAIIVLLIVKILPMFGDILESMGAKMPAAAGIILNTGFFLAKFAPVIILVILVVIIAFVYYIRTDKGRFNFDKSKLSIPAYNYVYCRIITARFSRSLSILLKSGVQLLNALEDLTVLTDNKYLEKKLVSAVENVKLGGNPAEVLSEIGIFPILFQRLFIIGQKTGNLDEMLEKAATVFDEEADDAIKRFSDMLEPLLIIILSVIVGAILLSVMLPMITIMNSIG